MTLEIGSRVLKLSAPWGEPGEIRHIDQDTCFVVWPCGKLGSIDRRELCLADNITQQGAAKKRTRAKRA